MSLIDGDYTAILKKDETILLNDIFDKIDKTKITNLFAELNRIEKEIKDLDSLKKKMKKEIGIKFSNGF